MINASALQLLLAILAGSLDRQQREVLRYLVEENGVLRRQLRGRRLQLTDDDRRRLAVRAYRLGRRRLRTIATIVTPDRLLRLAPAAHRAEVTYAKLASSRRGLLVEIRRLVRGESHLGLHALADRGRCSPNRVPAERVRVSDAAARG